MHAPNVLEVECQVSNVIALFTLTCRRDGAQIVKAMTRQVLKRVGMPSSQNFRVKCFGFGLPKCGSMLTAASVALIKCNADPACLAPNDVTVVIAVLDVDDKIE
jgi:hypothetical protein